MALRPRMGIAVLAGALLAGAVLAGCGSGGASSSTSDKYEQTWTNPYAETTCADFTKTMTAKQRWAMAADMLVSSRRVDGAKDMPEDDMVTEFMGGMDTACVVPTMAVTDIAAALYVTERARFQPTP